MEKRHCRVPAVNDGRRGSGRGSLGSADAHQDWAGVFPHVLDLAKEHLSKEEAIVFLRSGHLVNHHWSNWAVGAARCLELEIGIGDREQKLMGVVNRFTALENVIFASTSNIGDTVLLLLQRLSRLRQLMVHDSNLLGPCGGYEHPCAITDVGFAHIGAMATLADLDLSFCTSLTDHGVAELRNLTNLKRLSLRRCQNVTEASLAHFTMLRSLADLDMRNCNHDRGISDTGVGHLGKISSLTKLAISTAVNTISDEGASILGTMTGLVSLNITRCVRTTAHLVYQFPGILQFVSNLTNLTELRSPPTSCTVLQSLGVLSALSTLALFQCPRPDKDLLNVLKQWRHLSRLHLHSAGQWMNYESSIIGNLTGLTCLALYFSWPNVNQDGFTWLSNLSALENLKLGSGRRRGTEPDSIVQSLRPLTRFRNLNLSACPRMSGRFICFLTCLVELHLHNNLLIGDDDLREFATLTALTLLDLGACKKVTNEGLISLGGLSNLAQLDLRETSVTDAGLWHLLPLRFLQRVCLDGCAGLSHNYGGWSFGVWRRILKGMV